MTHITCRLTAKNRDQLRNATLGNRVWASFFTYVEKGVVRGKRIRSVSRLAAKRATIWHCRRLSLRVYLLSLSFFRVFGKKWVAVRNLYKGDGQRLAWLCLVLRALTSCRHAGRPKTLYLAPNKCSTLIDMVSSWHCLTAHCFCILLLNFFLYFCAVMKCCMKTGVYAYTSDLISKQVSKTFIKCIRHIK